MASSFLAKAIHRKSLADILDIHLAKAALANNTYRAAQLLDPVGFHPSQIDACLRSVFYSWCGVPMTSNLPKPKTQRIFDNGDYFHERMQKYFRDMGILEGQWICRDCKREWKGIAGHCPKCGADTRAQKYDEIDFKKGWVIGSSDGVVTLVDRRIVIELKSMNDREFSMLKKAKDNHRAQGNCYMWGLDVEECAFIYENKNSQEIKVFIEKRDDKIIANILKRIDGFVNNYWKKGILPDRECDNPNWCAYQHECYIAKRTAKVLLQERERLIKEKQANAIKEATNQAKSPVDSTIKPTQTTDKKNTKASTTALAGASRDVGKKPILTNSAKAFLLKRRGNIAK